MTSTIPPRRPNGRSRSRIVAAVTAAIVAAASLSPAGAANAQQPDPADDAPAGGQPANPAPAEPAPGEVIHSWSLAPAGSDDPSEAGNRPNLSYVTDPGSVIDDAVTLYNYSTEPLTFRVYATDAFNNDDGQLDLLPGSEEPTDVGAWVDVAEEFITLPSNTQVTVPITITVPEDASPGDHTGAVIAASDAISTGDDGEIVTLDRRTGTRLLVRVNGPLTPSLAITNLSTDYDSSMNPLGGSATVTYDIENQGNVRLSGTTVVSVAGPFGLGEVVLPPQQFPELLPGERTSFSVELADVPAFGVANATVAVTPEGDGVDVPPVSKTARSIAVPVAVLLGLLFVLLAVLAARALKRHRERDAAGEVVVLPPGAVSPPSTSEAILVTREPGERQPT